MVAYCCVKGCNNNSSNKKKDPNDMTSFHAFPSNVEMKQKWLRAIGRPDWNPPSYSRVCSGHFSYEQINHDGRRIRIKDDAVPVKDLPVNSNFAASDVEVCRFCLATDLQLYSLQDGVHKVYLESIIGSHECYNIEGLPQFICYECAAHLKKCYNLLERSLTVQATLLDIFAQNGMITTNLINLKNRKELNLTSPLTIHEINTINEFKYMDDLEGDGHVDQTEDKFKTVHDNITIPKFEVANIIMIPDDIREIENYEATVENKDMAIKIDDNSECIDVEFHNSTDLNSEDEMKSEPESMVIENEIKPRKARNSVKTSCHDRLTPDEANMEKYFNIVFLKLDQQVEEWSKREVNKQFSGEALLCEICSKKFAHHNTYKMHVRSHDPSRGNSECPVCKVRFKNEVLVRSHANRAHAKKFYCKLCPKAFSNVGVAKKHHLWHSGHVYSCAACPFSSAHASALHAHARAAHAAHSCARCGRAFGSARGLRLHEGTVHRGANDSPVSPEENPKYQCQQCGLNFKSEGARRVHILTSKAHKKKTSLCDPTPQDPSLKNTCSKCGIEFPSMKALIEHGRAEHRRAKQKTSWRLPGDSYPTQCEHCGVAVASRAAHWAHVRRAHPAPAQRAAYRAVVTAVCHTCGKGFQNSTKLRLHALRHSPPSVRCACGRAFHDKYALARHAAAHAPARPHRCARCPRAFKQRGNLHRHSRVHTGVTPYECSMCGKKFKYSTSMNLHVRTVHYKLPHPPRKRNKKLNETDNSQNKC